MFSIDACLEDSDEAEAEAEDDGKEEDEDKDEDEGGGGGGWGVPMRRVRSLILLSVQRMIETAEAARDVCTVRHEGKEK